MTDDRLLRAIGRLERALSRIEVSGKNRPAPLENKPDPALALLDRRHIILRSRTQAAITRLDRLIGTEAQD
jgi:hypothetical protein